ncbi:NADP oxidoreductase coenzyme F420-dependent [Streptomyces sp. S4.7]|uniref:NADPH-dependent F420 reductase n=1 Tax=unclassified Streptomyces TaxID=2593676 RepID=UPI001398F205|nr:MULTISPECIES: NAD(P)-binding domain-containing protein [unclassified Streptomyces]QHY96736.1 NADP oxidoreductase coenzyme F420-dependent [Streptomyces sp. S4.7]
MRIGFLGTGFVARAVAAGAAAAGHDVVLGSRDPKAAADRELGLPVTGLAEAVEHGGIVVNATPGTVSLELLGELRERLAGRILLDIAVGLTDDMALAHPNSSIGEQLQRALPETRVVKTLATMDSAAMVDPGGLSGESTVFLSGDDAGAKAEVGALLGDLGWPAGSRLDLGGIETARGQEHFALLFIGIAGALGTYTFNIKVVPSKKAAK